MTIQTDRSSFSLSLLLIGSLAFCGCVPAASDTAGHDGTSGSTEPTGGTTMAAPAVCEPFAPYVIDVQAEPNGLYYRADQQALYIADDDNNRILVRTDAGQSSVFAQIPNPSGDPGADGLGDLDFADDGWLYVPRFGFGMPGLGAVFRVAPDGTPEQIAGVNADWRRVGLDYDDARGLLYVATFSKDANNVFTGWISAVDPAAGTETTIVAGLRKPVGVVVSGDQLYVGDQMLRHLYRVDLGAATPALALVSDQFEALDLMKPAPRGDLFALSYDTANSRGYVYRVTPAGKITTVATGDWEPRGLAFDGTSRIFISARDSQEIVVVPAC